MISRPVGAVAPDIADILTDGPDNDAIDLTDYTSPLFSMRPINSATLTVGTQPAAFISGTTGGIAYTPAPADVDTAGTYAYWWDATDPDGDAFRSPLGYLELVDNDAVQPSGTDLCSLLDVKLGLDGVDDDAQDTLLATLITAASRVCTQYVGREFANTGLATRSFDITGEHVSFSPYDLRAGTTAPTVTLVSSAGGTATLSTTTYRFRPLSSPDGTYRALKFLVSYYPSEWYTCQVAGVWGMASVPAPVVRACVLTVQEWYRSQSTIPVSDLDGGISGRITSIPYGARELLNPYRVGRSW